MQIDYAELAGRLSQGNEKFALLTMQATSTTRRLAEEFPDRLAALFSAEHGFFGCAAPGEATTDGWHPHWNLPVHSLYGEHRCPTNEMLKGVGRMVIDLCDIGVRCYTYLATLRNVLVACAQRGIPVTVLDRPVPMGGVVDGPMLEPSFVSFVAPVNVPLSHGMTPGECATWIRRTENLTLDLDVVRVRDWSHADRTPWPNFIPPSPAIRSWDAAALYPMTVFTEAYGAIDCDRAGSLAFRVVGAPWLDAKALAREVDSGLAACGVETRPYRYVPKDGPYRDTVLDGLLFSVAHAGAYYPVTAGVLVLAAILRQNSAAASAGARGFWMDKLYGTTKVRETVLSRSDTLLGALIGDWLVQHDGYVKSRVDLYDAVGAK